MIFDWFLFAFCFMLFWAGMSNIKGKYITNYIIMVKSAFVGFLIIFLGLDALWNGFSPYDIITMQLIPVILLLYLMELKVEKLEDR